MGNIGLLYDLLLLWSFSNIRVYGVASHSGISTKEFQKNYFQYAPYAFLIAATLSSVTFSNAAATAA
jgi:hypothetical protein